MPPTTVEATKEASGIGLLGVLAIRLKCAAFGWLGQFHVFFQRHQATQLRENCLNCVFPLPLGQDWYVPVVHLRRRKFTLSNFFLTNVLLSFLFYLIFF